MAVHIMWTADSDDYACALAGCATFILLEPLVGCSGRLVRRKIHFLFRKEWLTAVVVTSCWSGEAQSYDSALSLEAHSKKAGRDRPSCNRLGVEGKQKENIKELSTANQNLSEITGSFQNRRNPLEESNFTSKKGQEGYRKRRKDTERYGKFRKIPGK